MIPYASFLYFGVVLYVVAPTVVMRAAGRLPRMWIACATVAMLVVHYAYARTRWPDVLDVPQLWSVGAYGVFEWAVASVFLRTRAVIPPSPPAKAHPIDVSPEIERVHAHVGSLGGGRATAVADPAPPAVSPPLVVKPSVSPKRPLPFSVALVLRCCRSLSSRLGRCS